MLVLLMAAILAAPQFEVQTLSGEAAEGKLVALSPDTLVLQTDNGEKSFAVKDLLSATATRASEAPRRLPIAAELIDGTRILAESVRSADGVATLKLTGGRTLQVPIKQLRWIRTFDAAEPIASARHDAAWADLTSGNAVGDVLVIRNKGNLVATDGVVGDITAETVGFTLDENSIDVKRAKIEGIIFAKTAHEDLPQAVGVVVATNGARWQVKQLALREGQIRLTTSAGIETELPLDGVSKFDFSQGKLVYLSDLETETFEYQPYFSLAKPLDSIDGFYRLRRDVSLENQPLQLDGKVYRKGLAMHSRSRAVYRLPGKFQKFTAVVGIDDAVRNVGGDLLLEISGDGKSLWKGNVRGGEAPQALDLDISGVKRLEILADYGADVDVADHLDLCEAKVVK
jgi:hypothetical protein